MGADRGGPLGGRRRVAQHRLRVAGRLRVVGQAGEVGRAGRERVEGAPVEVAPAVRGQRLLDRHPGQLVAEREAARDRPPRCRSRAPRPARRRRHSASTSHSSACGTATETASTTPVAAAPSRAVRASTASRTVAGMRRRRPRAPRRRRTGCRPSRGTTPPDRGRTARRAPRRPPATAATPPAGVPAAARRAAGAAGGPVQLVVAVAGHDQRRHRLDAAAQQRQHVERRLVGPVQILQDDDGARPRAGLAGDHRHHLVRLRARVEEVAQLTAGLVGDVDERAERAGREQRVAGAPENPVALGGEAAQQGRLAAAGLAAQEDEHAPAPARGVARLAQGREVG